MIRRFIPLAAALLALGTGLTTLPAHAQTKPKVEVPAETKRDAHAIVQQLLREGRITRASSVQRGMQGYALSVFQGTAIEKFPVEILGVLSRIQGGGDLVLFKVLGGTVVKRQAGIIAGMSGSPVYINGKLLGAISFSIPFGKEPIGLVTPITDMLETALPDPARKKLVAPSGKILPAPSIPQLNPAPVKATTYQLKKPVQIAGRNVTRLAVTHDHRRYAFAGPTAATTMTIRPASTLLQLSGFSESALPRLRRILEPYDVEPVIGPSSHKTGVHPSFEPGSALGVQLVSGDMDMTAVGTITFRWGQRILAFGHPMFGQGAASLPMTSAYVYDIIPSYNNSMKLASPVDVVGALQQDTQFAIGGTVGMKADTIPMSVSLSDPARQIERTYHVQVMKDPVQTPDLIGEVATQAMQATLGGASDKMVRVGLRMDIDNSPPIVRHNYLYANSAVAGAALTDLGQTLSITQMNEFARGSIRRVDLSIAIEAVRKTARIKQVFANRNRIKAGETVQVSVVMEPTDTPNQLFTRTFQFSVPADAPTGLIRIGAATAADYWPLQVRVGGPPPDVTNLQELVAAWGKVGASNDLLVQASSEKTFLKVDRQTINNPAPSWMKLLRTASSTSIGSYNEVETRYATTDYSLTGAQFLLIPVEGIRHPERIATTAPSTTVTDVTTTTTTTTKSSDAPVPSESDGDTGAAALAFNDRPEMAYAASQPFDFDQTFHHSSFLTQLRVWQQQAAGYGQGNALGQAVAHRFEAQQILPPRQIPSNPIAPGPAIPTPLPTPLGGATPTPAPTALPTPSVSTTALSRPAQSWVQNGVSDFLTGHFDQTFATNEGLIRLAPATKLLATTSEPFGWSIAADGKGNTYLGTGSKARITKIAANGDQSLFYDGPEVAVTALTSDPAGNIYAGVTPGGRVYKFTPDGQRSVFFDSGQTFVWALTWDASGHLLIGTGGDMGRLYRQTDAGMKELAHLPQKHIRAIATQDNDIYVGTGAEGVLYKIDAATGTAKALFQASGTTEKSIADTEILAVAAAPDGIYFGTSSDGTIYRWTSAEGAIPLYTSPQQAIYALLYIGSNAASERLYAATGDQGVVYQIQPGHDANDTRVARMLEPTQLQALTLAIEPDAKHLLIGTGNNAAAYRVALQDTPSGTFMSAVFDAKNVAQWGTVRWLGQGATVETRSGNTVDPDPSWSDWQATTANDLGEQHVASPAARYLQYRVRLSGAAQSLPINLAPDAGPSVSRIEVVYRTKNSPPSVGLAAPVGGEYWSGKKHASWMGKDPDSDPLRYRLSLSSDDGKTWQNLPLDDATASSQEIDTTKWHDGTYRLKVEASDAARNPDDPQHDESTSLPFIIDNTPPRITGAKLTSGPTGTGAMAANFQFTATVTDDLSPIVGAEWRIVTDKPATTDKTLATSAAGSKDKTTPDASKTPGSDISKTLGITVTDADTTKEANDKDDDWQAIAASDGIFDSRREAVTALISSTETTAKSSATTPKGERKIEVRAHDAAGNTTTLTLPWPKP